MVYRDRFPNCFQCGIALKRFTVMSHAYGRCEECGGAWVEHAVLQGMVEEMREEAVPAMYEVKRRGDRRCLQCQQPMKVARLLGIEQFLATLMNRHLPSFVEQLGGPDALTAALKVAPFVDVCEDHGVWFDREELQTVLMAASGHAGD